MLPILLVFVFSPTPNAPAGSLVPADPKTTLATLPYHPREGDLVFFDDRHPLWTALFIYAGSGPPLHVGLVVKRYNGSLAILEAGPDDSLWVTIQPVAARLQQFHTDYQGAITVRRCKKKLTPGQSRALTRFAEGQEGKRYALIRLLLQGTMFRSRGPIRELFLANTQLDRWSWICSELAVAGAHVAQLMPTTVKSNVTYPRDLINNRRHDLSATYHPLETWRRGKQ